MDIQIVCQFYIDNIQKDNLLLLFPYTDFKIGDGFIWSDGTRYRIVDRYHSFDHHGAMSDGVLHIFLEKLTTEDIDRPLLTYHDYFKD